MKHKIGYVVYGHSQWDDKVHSVMGKLRCQCSDDWASIGHCAAVGCSIEVRREESTGEADMIVITSDVTPDKIAKRLAVFLMHETGCMCVTGLANRHRFSEEIDADF